MHHPVDIAFSYQADVFLELMRPLVVGELLRELC
jgi:hypothetical protein